MYLHKQSGYTFRNPRASFGNTGISVRYTTRLRPFTCLFLRLDESVYSFLLGFDES